MPRAGKNRATRRDLPAATLGGRVLDRKVVRAAMGAAQRKFSPEFMNRLDKIIVFKPLGPQELSKVLDIELKRVQERVFLQWGQQSFVFTTSDAAKSYLLREGTDMRYGARHLKRGIERLLIQPLSHQMVVEQLRGGDYIRVDFNDESSHLAFHKEAEHLSLEEMMKLADRGSTS
jgi:ATP-dependent Clp protease ATP-binding subunit ClpB